MQAALQAAGWSWDRQLRLGPGRVNIASGSIYDSSWNRRLTLPALKRQRQTKVLNALREAILRETFAGNM